MQQMSPTASAESIGPNSVFQQSTVQLVAPSRHVLLLPRQIATSGIIPTDWNDVKTTSYLIPTRLPQSRTVMGYY